MYDGVLSRWGIAFRWGGYSCEHEAPIQLGQHTQQHNERPHPRLYEGHDFCIPYGYPVLGVNQTRPAKQELRTQGWTKTQKNPKVVRPRALVVF